tara:strand:+ start:1431 stop:2303 length:873 start_codon:yes stop_codon:yes gene_type:complete
MKEVIKISDILYKVKTKIIIDSISFSVYDSDSYALLGENGSGKSTLIDLILNDLKSDNGNVVFFGKQKNNFKNIGIVYDHLPLFPLLKVNEIIRYFTTIHKLDYKVIKTLYFEIFEIEKIANSFIKELSLGERKRVGLLLSIIHNPNLLILDEPFSNLDPTITDRIWRILRQNNRTIFFTTHNWKDVEKLATKIGFIYEGKLIQKSQSPNEIIKNLPAGKKVTVNKNTKLNDKLINLNYYKHDDELHIFLDKKKDILDMITKTTTNFSVQDIGLKDAYLYHISKCKKVVL